MGRAGTYALDGFGSGGVVTDVSPERLKASQLAAAENMVLPDGAVTERGGWASVGDDDPLVDSVSFRLVSVMEAVNIDTGGTELAVTGVNGTADDWNYGLATTGAGEVASPLTNEGEYWVRAYYRGEALLAPRNGTSQIRRWAFLTESDIASTTGTGTYSVADGSNQLVGAGSNFDPQLPVGAFVGGGFGRDSLHRVVARTSDTKAGLASKADWDVPSQNASIVNWGVIGLKVLVTNIGLATHGSSATSITGNGTKWAQSGPGFGVVEVGDWLLRVNDNIANALRVTAVGGDTSLTVHTNSVGAFTDAAYVILRPACGREVCEHDNAIWVAGVDWAKSTAYTTPAGYEPAHVTNGRFGKTVQADEAMRMFEVPIPSPEAPGEILAMRSTPWGLAVGKSDSLWVVTGQYPSLDVRRVADLGLIEQRAMVSVDDMLVFAGREGFFAWQGGRPQDLTEGRTGEWIEKAAQMTRCVLGVVRGHLFVSFEIPAGPECWVYDLQRGVHLGNFTSADDLEGIESAVYMDSSRIPGQEDRLLFVVNDADVLSVQDASTTIIGPTTDNEAPTTNLGQLEVWTGSNLGGPISRRSRVVGAKVSYVCVGDDPGDIDVVTRVDGGAEAAEVTLPETTAATSTVRIPASSGGVGRECRSFQIGIRHSGGTNTSRVSLREVETVVRSRRPRA